MDGVGINYLCEKVGSWKLHLCNVFFTFNQPSNRNKTGNTLCVSIGFIAPISTMLLHWSAGTSWITAKAPSQILCEITNSRNLLIHGNKSMCNLHTNYEHTTQTQRGHCHALRDATLSMALFSCNHETDSVHLMTDPRTCGCRHGGSWLRSWDFTATEEDRLR